jgi:hypothetical protein
MIVTLGACGRSSQERPTAGIDPTSITASELLPFNEQRWAAMTGNSWSYMRRTGSKDDDIVTDATAPFVPPTMLRIIFTPDMQRDSEPGVHWIPLPNKREVLTEWWMKLSPNWTSSPAGGGKISFLLAAPDGQGQVYSGVFGSREPHHISINTEWMPYGQKIWEPNAARTPVLYDRWYRIQWYMRWASAPGARDGVLRWFVDGTLNGDYFDVVFPSGGVGFQQFEFAPTLQNPPRTEQYMYIGPTFLSSR